MEVKKAVILAAGLGTRFLPVTKSMPKEMLPIIDTPVIHYVIEEAIESGIDDILIITGRGKRAVEDYFDAAPELEAYLEEKKDNVLLKMIRDISSLADIHYIRQKNPIGLGDAVLRAEKHVGNEPFVVLLGDDIIQDRIPCTKQLIDIFYRYRCTVIAAQDVPKKDVNKYGIIKGINYEDNLYFVEDIVEKPKMEEAPSTLGTVGRYVFTPEIFDCIKRTTSGVGNEIQLTDAIALLKDMQKIYAYKFHGKRYDTGDKAGYVQAIIDFALENGEIRENILDYLKKIV
jgi:UTP--glucose-1-phosphate uridylyltransferase